MKKLHISKELALPQDVVTSTLVIYGGKGMGKTNFGSVLAEELAGAGLRFSIIDPMGVWWGLRHSVDGKGRGIEVLILGGIHGDIPIEPTGGAVVADLVVDEDANVMIDISRRPDGTMWSIGERVRFVTDYSKQLYRRQGERRRPILQIYDEAARFIPQTIRKGEEHVAVCMGAIAVLVEEGRNVAIGVMLLTQRSARLNKDVAELADCMIAFRTVGPNSRRAVLDWLGEHVEKERLKDLDAQVRALPRGSALVVSPGWLEYEGVAAMRARQTFDSSATPKPGEERRASGPGAKPDLAKYQARMAATIEKAKQEDPKELKKRIAELERQLKAKAPAGPARVETKTVEKLVEKRIAVPILRQSELRILESVTARMVRIGEQVVKTAQVLGAEIAKAPKVVPPVQTSAIGGRVSLPQSRSQNTTTPDIRRDMTPVKKTVTRAPAAASEGHDDGQPVSSAQQSILNAALFLEGLGIPVPSVVQLALFAKQTAQGGYWRRNIGRLRTLGLMAGVELTQAGRARAEVPAITTVAELHAFALTLCEGAQKQMLQVLLDVYPESLEVTEMGARLGKEPQGGYWRRCVGRLRSLGLITKRGPLAALPILFPEGM